MKLPVITLWQPWATWIILGWKTIETRTHNRFKSLAGKTIYIHAAKKWDGNAVSWAMPWMTDVVFDRYAHEDYPQGAIIGTAFVEEHRKLELADSNRAMIICDDRYARFGLILKDIEALSPIYVMGRQGIWSYEDKRKASVCGVDCHPGDSICNGYCTGKVNAPPPFNPYL
jgi:hypothetical protein